MSVDVPDILQNVLAAAVTAGVVGWSNSKSLREQVKILESNLERLTGILHDLEISVARHHAKQGDTNGSDK